MYESLLPSLNKTEAANSYFFDRGVSQEVFDAFELGSIEGQSSRETYHLIGKPCFPIRDINGELISIGSRPGTSWMKYYYLPFPKNKTLYGLHIAAPHILEKGFVFVVEGIFDALLMHSHGYTNTVATMGSSMSRIQLLLLTSYTNGIKYIPDMDGPGLTEFDKNRSMMYNVCKDINIDPLFTYPHKDIADFLKNGGELNAG